MHRLRGLAENVAAEGLAPSRALLAAFDGFEPALDFGHGLQAIL